MLNLKSIYFYFLAKKINIIKIVKKIYFKTNFYNESLKSRIPEKFYFYPNPFLLSFLAESKRSSFKVSKIDADMFWKNQETKKDRRNLHNFFWLNLIDRKNDGFIIQKIITIWIFKNFKYKNIIWEDSIISRRIISWILNANIILNKTENVFKNNFFESIVVQTNHLKKNIKFQNNYSTKIEIICAILLTGLVFKEYRETYESNLKDLEKLVDSFFDNDGFPLNRNPNDLVKFSKYLILIKECIKDSQEYVPDFLDEIIEKILNCLKSIVTPKNEIPLFNGATEINLEEYLIYIEGLKYKLLNKKGRIGNLQIIKNKRNIVFFDVGRSPTKEFSSDYQSGPLSFEYFLDGEKIITNCGFGRKISKKAVLLSRLTSAQSTLTLNDNSVVKFERSKSLNKAFGNSIKNNFKVFNFSFTDDDYEIRSSSTHDAYEDSFGYHHRREIKIDKKSGVLLGLDELTASKVSTDADFNVRFHLYPGVNAVQTMAGNSILIQMAKNKSLVFKSEGENLSIEKSIFLGRNKILNNLCITISGNISTRSKNIHWEIRKSF